MANSTILYGCTSEGVVISTRPGTLPEWLPPRRVLVDETVTSLWAETGPPIRVLAVASGRLMGSENGGRTWSEIPMDAPVKALLSFGEPPSLLAVMQGGRLAMSPDGGTGWESLPGLPAAGDVLSSCVSDNQIYLVMEQAGERSLVSGDPRAGVWRTLVSGEMITAVTCEAGAAKLYAGFADGVRVSNDGGMNWRTSDGSPGAASALAVIPGATGKPPALVVGSDLRLSVSQDGGVSWQEADLGEAGGVSALARDPERRDRIYAATSTGYLFESGNRGQSWERINPSPLPPASYLYAMRI